MTEGLEGVYLLAIDNLGEQDEAQPQPTESVPNLDDGVVGGASSAAPGGDGAGGGGGGSSAGNPGGKTKRSPAATARQAPKRTAADTAFPSLVHLASRGEQRKRAGSAKARYPSAEPVFIASLARRGGGAGDQQQQESDDGRRSRRHSTGLGGLGPRRRAGSRAAAAPFECLWWVTRDGDHFAIIGGPGGEVRGRGVRRKSSGWHGRVSILGSGAVRTRVGTYISGLEVAPCIMHRVSCTDAGTWRLLFSPSFIQGGLVMPKTCVSLLSR